MKHQRNNAINLTAHFNRTNKVLLKEQHPANCIREKRLESYVKHFESKKQINPKHIALLNHKAGCNDKASNMIQLFISNNSILKSFLMQIVILCSSF